MIRGEGGGAYQERKLRYKEQRAGYNVYAPAATDAFSSVDAASKVDRFAWATQNAISEQ